MKEQLTATGIKAWRERQQLSQEGLARQLGVSTSSVRNWERGIGPSQLARVALERLMTPLAVWECPVCYRKNEGNRDKCRNCGHAREQSATS